MQTTELDIWLRPSRWAQVYVVAVHLLTGLCWWFLTPAGWLRWLVLLVICLSGGLQLRRARQHIVRLQWHAGTWWLTGHGDRYPQTVGLTSAYVSQSFVIMRFCDENKRCMPLVFWPDMLDKTCFRRLRMYCLDQRFYRR